VTDDVGDRAGAAGRQPTPVPTDPESTTGGASTSPWLARRLGEDVSQQLARIRRTCRWCGDRFAPRERIELARHERAHVTAEHVAHRRGRHQ
jgi:hypothetical protein